MRDVTIKCGDPNVAEALAEGVNAVQLREVQAENARLSAVCGVRSRGDDRRWERQKRRLARKYTVKPDGRVKGALMGVYGLMVLAVHQWGDYLDEWHRTGVRPSGKRA